MPSAILDDMKEFEKRAKREFEFLDHVLYLLIKSGGKKFSQRERKNNNNNNIAGYL